MSEHDPDISRTAAAGIAAPAAAARVRRAAARRRRVSSSASLAVARRDRACRCTCTCRSGLERHVRPRTGDHAVRPARPGPRRPTSRLTVTVSHARQRCSPRRRASPRPRSAPAARCSSAASTRPGHRPTRCRTSRRRAPQARARCPRATPRRSPRRSAPRLPVRRRGSSTIYQLTGTASTVVGILPAPTADAAVAPSAAPPT